MTCWEWLGHSIYVRHDPGPHFGKTETVNYQYPETPVGKLTTAELHEILRWCYGGQ